MSTRMRSLIGLYQSAAKFPNRQSVLSHIDSALLGEESMNSAHSFPASHRPTLRSLDDMVAREGKSWQLNAQNEVNSVLRKLHETNSPSTEATFPNPPMPESPSIVSKPLPKAAF